MELISAKDLAIAFSDSKKSVQLITKMTKSIAIEVTEIDGNFTLFLELATHQ